MNKAIDEMLKQYPFIGADIQREQATLNEYIALQIKARDPLKAQTLSDMPHMPDGNTSDPTADAVERVIDKYQEKIDEQVTKINELIDRQKWLDKAYASLTEDERRIVCLRYNDRWATWDIMRRMGMKQYKSFYKVLNSAKQKIKKIMLT